MLSLNVETPKTFKIPLRYEFPLTVRFPAPASGERTIFPVVPPPIVSVLFSVVWIDLGAPASVRSPENEAVPVVVRFVKLPVDGVVAPIAVLLIPVAVVLKLFEVIIKLFPPVLITEAESPERLRVPEVAVKLIAPVVRVNPLDAVINPFDVIVPVPVVEIFPLVVRFPSSLIVRVELPLDWISRDVFIFALLSLMIKALAVP